MRPVLHGDVTALARLLLAAAPTARGTLCARVIGEADAADRHLRRTGRVHPLWGAGSIMSAARKRRLPPEPGLGDRDYCLCLETVFRELAAWRARAQPAQEMQRRTVGSSSSRFAAISSPHSSQ